MAALVALAAGAAAAGTLAVLILWRSSRREAAHVRHVDALMAEALAELRSSERALLHDQFDQIVADNWSDDEADVIRALEADQ
jgi:hypothetical protein